MAPNHCCSRTADKLRPHGVANSVAEIVVGIEAFLSHVRLGVVCKVDVLCGVVQNLVGFVVEVGTKEECSPILGKLLNVLVHIVKEVYSAIVGGFPKVIPHIDGKESRAISPAGNNIAHALLVVFSDFGIGPNFVGAACRAAVDGSIGVIRPSPIIGRAGEVKLVVVVCAEHYSETGVFTHFKNVIKVGAHNLIIVAQSEISCGISIRAFGHPFNLVALADPNAGNVCV